MKVACYIDGFNLYHAINELHKPHLKWLDLWALAASLCREGETLEKVAYFSAFATWLPAANARHRQYVAALRATGVECHLARFNNHPVVCKACGASWVRHEEKETDVHFSLTLLEDAIDGVSERAIIVSADSDHVPAVRRVKSRFPRKQLFLAAPPGRRGHAHELQKVCGSNIEITRGRLARCLLPSAVVNQVGAVVAVRPPEYDPPPESRV